MILHLTVQSCCADRGNNVSLASQGQTSANLQRSTGYPLVGSVTVCSPGIPVCFASGNQCHSLSHLWQTSPHLSGSLSETFHTSGSSWTLLTNLLCFSGGDKCVSLLHQGQTPLNLQLPRQNPRGLLGQVQWGDRAAVPSGGASARMHGQGPVWQVWPGARCPGTDMLCFACYAQHTPGNFSRPNADSPARTYSIMVMFAATFVENTLCDTL